MASPLVQFQPKGRRDLVATVVRLVAEQGAGAVVVGLPLLESGQTGEEARRALAVVEALRQALAVPVTAWDERYTTCDAEAALRGAGLGREGRKDRRDKVAAAFILQAYLDRERGA